MTPDRDIEIGVRVGIDQGHIVVIEVETEIEMDGCNRDTRTLSDDREGSRSRSNLRVSTNRDQLRCYRYGEYDHFAQECPNMPTDDEMGHSDSETSIPADANTGQPTPQL